MRGWRAQTVLVQSTIALGTTETLQVQWWEQEKEEEEEDNNKKVEKSDGHDPFALTDERIWSQTYLAH